jgi:hypothetical protein
LSDAVKELTLAVTYVPHVEASENGIANDEWWYTMNVDQPFRVAQVTRAA